MIPHTRELQAINTAWQIAMQVLGGEGRTMIVVTHEIAFARDDGSRVFLSQGVIAEEGDSKEVLAKPQSERLRAFQSY